MVHVVEEIIFEEIVEEIKLSNFSAQQYLNKVKSDTEDNTGIFY